MKQMVNKAFRILGVLVLSGGALAAAKGAESTAGGTVTIEYYYKIVPGGMMPGGPSEWLSLYLKNHHPILQQLRKEGPILSEKLYERRFHAREPSVGLQSGDGVARLGRRSKRPARVSRKSSTRFIRTRRSTTVRKSVGGN